MENPKGQNVRVLDPGHEYELKNYEQAYEGTQIGQVGGEPSDLNWTYQKINFIHKEPKEGTTTGEMELVKNGTTNEAVVEMLIDRIKWLNNKMPSEFNEQAIIGLENVMSSLIARHEDRVSREVEGKDIK